MCSAIAPPLFPLLARTGAQAYEASTSYGTLFFSFCSMLGVNWVLIVWVFIVDSVILFSSWIKNLKSLICYVLLPYRGLQCSCKWRPLCLHPVRWHSYCKYSYLYWSRKAFMSTLSNWPLTCMVSGYLEQKTTRLLECSACFDLTAVSTYGRHFEQRIRHCAMSTGPLRGANSFHPFLSSL